MTEQANDTGSKDRATVSLVYRAVDDLKDLTAVQFVALHGKIDALASLPAQMGALHERQVLAEARIVLLEKADRDHLSVEDRRALYRRVNLPPLIISVLALALTAVALVL